VANATRLPSASCTFASAARRPARAVDDLTLAGYTSCADRPQEVNVHLYGGRPDAHQRQHREAHGVVYEGGVDPAVQRARAVQVYLLHGNAYGRAPRLDPFDLRPDVPGESYFLVKVLGEMVHLLIA
jgi:hypothetical protein